MYIIREFPTLDNFHTEAEARSLMGNNLQLLNNDLWEETLETKMRSLRGLTAGEGEIPTSKTLSSSFAASCSLLLFATWIVFGILKCVG